MHFPGCAYRVHIFFFAFAGKSARQCDGTDKPLLRGCSFCEIVCGKRPFLGFARNLARGGKKTVCRAVIFGIFGCRRYYFVPACAQSRHIESIVKADYGFRGGGIFRIRRMRCRPVEHGAGKRGDYHTVERLRIGRTVIKLRLIALFIRLCGYMLHQSGFSGAGSALYYENFFERMRRKNAFEKISKALLGICRRKKSALSVFHVYRLSVAVFRRKPRHYSFIFFIFQWHCMPRVGK